MISTLMVANRGEIARRIFATCRRLGIATVAVCPGDDTGDPHTADADSVVVLPGTALADTYLDPAALIGAALASGADAVHPGYGFLSEDAGFAADVIAAGLTWVGPPPAAIAAMGDKSEAKARMRGAGVPVLDGTDPGAVAADDLPVLVKAAKGGGGRGMRVVRALADLPGAVDSARAEAAAAFGDPEVFCEPYLDPARHIEVQVLADAHGTVWALGDRDCSVQRRHQKVIEEAPAPGIGAGLRADLHRAAVDAARACGYAGAGTVEFIVDAAHEGRFAFLEMNTRLQVEHPVTECVTGLDLVEWQIRVAEGAPLTGPPPEPAGHAVEARVYAEDPRRGWEPQPGTVHRFEVGGAAEFAVPEGGGIRVDSGVVGGSAVGVRYDALLAKVVAWAPTRGDALRRLAAALAGARIHGPVTNRDLLVGVLRHPGFRDGAVFTGFLDAHPEVAEPRADGVARPASALAAALAEAARNRSAAPVLGSLPAGFRTLPSQPHLRRYLDAGRAARPDEGPDDVIEAGYRYGRSGPEAVGAGGAVIVSAEPDRVVLDLGGVRRAFDVARYDGLVCVDSPIGAVALVPLDRFPRAAGSAAPGRVAARLPGTVRRVAARDGEPVEAGRLLLTVEAMKMEHELTAPVAGTVSGLRVRPGDRVATGDVLAEVTPAGPDTAEAAPDEGAAASGAPAADGEAAVPGARTAPGAGPGPAPAAAAPDHRAARHAPTDPAERTT